MKVKKTVDTPSLENIKKALENSGYLLEQRICPILENAGYKVGANIQYEDIDTGKSCEFDVVATREIKLSVDTKNSDSFSVIILVSCKNNHFPVVAFTRKEAPEWTSLPDTIRPLGAPSYVASAPLDYVYDFSRFHHYYKDEYVATQYCMININKHRKDEYIAIHGDLYDDLYKLCKVIHAKEQETIRFVLLMNSSNEKTNESKVDMRFVYPVMLFGGELYECRLQGYNHEVFKKNHILLWQDIVSRNIKKAFGVDMIEEAYLPEHLKTIKKEINAMQRMFQKDIKDLRSSAYDQLLRIKKYGRNL